MKLLWVTGDDEYASLVFEDDLKLNNPESLKKIWDTANAFTNKTTYVGSNQAIACEALTFTAVDPAFLDFIRDRGILDYDESKHSNFYIVGE